MKTEPMTIPPPSEADLARSLEDDWKLCEGATEGPWHYNQSADGTEMDPGVWVEGRTEYGGRDAVFACCANYSHKDGIFTAASRLGWPSAIRRASAAERERDELRGILSMASCFKVGEDTVRTRSIGVERRFQADGEARWAVTTGGYCLNREGLLEYEPLPSSREDDFIERTRFTFAEALRLAEELSRAPGLRLAQ